MHFLITSCPILWPNKRRLTKRLFRFLFAHFGQQIRLFLLTPVLVIRSEAVCESAASILKQHTHGNRSLDHISLDEELIVYWNATPLHLADPFIKPSINHYLFQLNDKDWIFFRKTERYRLFKFVSLVSVVLNRLRTRRRISMFYEQSRTEQNVAMCFYFYFVSNKVGL